MSFHRPAFLNESHGKVIEQWLVGGEAAHVAEIVHAGHEAFTEEMMPHAVGKHARGEWVLGVGQPVGQLNRPRLWAISGSPPRFSTWIKRRGVFGPALWTLPRMAIWMSPGLSPSSAAMIRGCFTALASSDFNSFSSSTSRALSALSVGTGLSGLAIGLGVAGLFSGNNWTASAMTWF